MFPCSTQDSNITGGTHRNDPSLARLPRLMFKKLALLLKRCCFFQLKVHDGTRTYLRWIGTHPMLNVAMKDFLANQQVLTFSLGLG